MLWIDGGQVADPTPRKEALRIDGPTITGKAKRAPPGARVIDASGLFLVPAFIDAHVHLSVAGEPALVAREELRKGVAAVLDLGAPEKLLPLDVRPLRTRFSGPLLTAPEGYPTQTWGKDGHGLGVATAEEARAAVRRFAEAGARFAKLAFDVRFPVLAPVVAKAAADEAHLLGLLVAAHALDAESVRRALDADVDVFAHTPRDELPEEMLQRFRGKWVISTLHAFGVEPSNLRRLWLAGARIAYGTDLGNDQTEPGIDPRELKALGATGIDPLRAATRESAALLGLHDMGGLFVSSAASLLAVRGLDPDSLAAPVWVMNNGRMLV